VLFLKVIVKQLSSLYQISAELHRNYLGSVIWGIRNLISHFIDVRFSFAKRHRNQMAHRLTQLAFNEPNQVWMEEYLSSFYDCNVSKINKLVLVAYI